MIDAMAGGGSCGGGGGGGDVNRRGHTAFGADYNGVANVIIYLPVLSLMM